MQTHGIEHIELDVLHLIRANLKRVSRVWGFNASITNCVSYSDMEWIE